MKQSTANRFAFVSVAYWVMLFYMVAALGWWFIALLRQNNEIAKLKLNALDARSATYQREKTDILLSKNRKIAQYVGEGGTFLVLIVLGAVYVFRATSRRLRLTMQQQNFMMAVTHELKTPISVAKLNLETLLKRNLPDEKKERLLGMTLRETDRLNNLCENILIASRFDAGDYRPQRARLDLRGIVDDCADALQGQYPHLQLEVVVPDAPVRLFGEEISLVLLVSNLLENAVKYSPEGLPVRLSCGQEGKWAYVEVADQGPGIPLAERSLVFDKFYRGGPEATRKAKGTGLGLFICKKIVAAHKGKIVIADNRPKGTKFIVYLKIEHGTKQESVDPIGR